MTIFLTTKFYVAMLRVHFNFIQWKFYCNHSTPALTNKSTEKVSIKSTVDAHAKFICTEHNKWIGRMLTSPICSRTVQFIRAQVQ